MGARRIDCITRGRSGGISHVGGRGEDGSRWIRPLDEVIAEVQAGKAYYCELDAQSYLLGVGTDRAGNRYLKAPVDADGPDCLLRLPACR